MLSAKLPLTLVAISGLGLAACTNPDGSANRTGTGAIIGGGLGAAAGRIIGNDTQGAVLGGIIGTGVGAAIGNQLDRQAADLERDIGGSGARIVNTGSELIVVLPEAITFDIESSVVRPNSRQNILAISRNLQQYPNSTVQVIGHTDNTGTRRFNQGLSIDRANAVRNVLVQGGVNGGRIRTIGRGENQPIASNGTVDGRQANRRVEIVITPNG
ncbi:MAG: OmpA family protein [Pseudomonadota bacterium]